MDRATEVLTEGLPSNVSASYRNLADHSGVPRSTLHCRARGQRSMQAKAQGQQYLTPPEENAVVEFMLRMSALGQPIRIKHVPCIALSATRNRPAPDRPLKPPGKNWAKALEKRHPELQARRVKALDWNRHEKNIYTKTAHWFEVIAKVMQDPEVLAENTYNMDETGVMLSKLGSVKVLVGKDDARDYRGARVKRTTVTAIECISGDGRYLHPMIIWPASTHRSNWTTCPTPGWHYAHSESGYTDSHITREWLQRVFHPQSRETANGRRRVLICDGFGTHETLEVLEFCFANNIVLCRLPSHTSHKLQPCDLAVFAPLKTAYRDNVERLERGGVNTIGKEHFVSLYRPARDRAFTRRNILAGWSKAGLFPFNPDRVLLDLPKPTDDSTTVEELQGRPYTQETTLREPITPVTPVSAQAFMSLQNIIVNHDARSLDHLSKQSLDRHVHKLAKAAQTSFARGALLQDQIKFLLQANNEAKVRRATASTVLGKAKVMSFEDLEEARAKRAEKEAAQWSKGKATPVRKRKNTMSQAGMDPEEVSTARAAEHTGEAQNSTDRDESLPWQPPVARMW